MTRRLAVVACLLTLTACTSAAPAPTTEAGPTASAITSLPEAPSTVPSTTPATTTTLIPRSITVVGEGDADVIAVVAGLYRWIGDRSAPVPLVDDAMITRLVGILPRDDAQLTAEVSTAAVGPGRVATVAVGDDAVLLADDGDGTWRIVGVSLPRFGVAPYLGDPIRHVLVLGTDARPGESQPYYRADSIHVLSINTDRHGGAVTGVPRDTYVEASYGHDKFTHVNALSPEYSREMVEIAEDITGLPFDGYVITGFVGFRTLVDGYGGVVVDVPFAMVDWRAEANLAGGRQRLWGADALAFSRVRSIPGGDFTRSLHQGMVVLAALDAYRERSVTALPQLLALLDRTTWTNLAPSELVVLAFGALHLEPDLVSNQVLAGTATTVGGASVVLLDDAANAPLFADLIDGVVDGA